MNPELLIWPGVAVSLLGVAMLARCIVMVSRARRARSDDTALRTALQRAAPLNLLALSLSAVGLMLVCIGVLLG